MGRSVMNVQSNYINNNYNVSMQGKSKPNGKFFSRIKNKMEKFEQKVLDKLPEREIKSDENTLNKKRKFDSFISRPAVNRLIMGVTAILFQPAIDYYNHRVDEETRTVSRNRTIAKIIAGTLVGMAVRGSSYHLIKKMTNPEGIKKVHKFFLPKDYVEQNLVSGSKELDNYRSALSTITALVAMVFTNFAIDAPATVYLTNKFNAKSIANGKIKGKEGVNG